MAKEYVAHLTADLRNHELLMYDKGVIKGIGATVEDFKSMYDFYMELMGTSSTTSTTSDCSTTTKVITYTSSPQTLTVKNYIVLWDYSLRDGIIYLPSAELFLGKMFVIKLINETGMVTITPYGEDTIDDQDDLIIDTFNTAVALVSDDNFNWRIY